jgi:plasmid stabilization system protein ParE
MKTTKIISVYAKTDLSDASKWYEQQQKGLGKRFLREVKEAINAISKNPLIYQVRYDDIRIYFTKLFPYGIHYRHVANKNEIHVIAVFHTSRNSDIWELRK